MPVCMAFLHCMGGPGKCWDKGREQTPGNGVGAYGGDAKHFMVGWSRVCVWQRFVSIFLKFTADICIFWVHFGRKHRGITGI